MGLMTTHITVTEITGEDASGDATGRVTEHKGYFEYMDAAAKQQSGIASADAAFAAIEPDGYGATWGLKPGDKLTAYGSTVSLINARVVRNPRTGAIHHIEADGG